MGTQYEKRISSGTSGVTLAEVKAELQIDGTAHDTRLTTLLGRVEKLYQAETGKGLSDTWELCLSEFPCGQIELAKFPLNTVTSIKYFDAENVEQTLLNDSYRIHKPTNERGFIEPVTSWPNTFERSDAVTIRYVAGSASELDQLAILNLICLSNENRQGYETPSSLNRMLRVARGWFY